MLYFEHMVLLFTVYPILYSICIYVLYYNYFIVIKYQFSITHHEVTRTRALRLREMRLYLLTHGGHAKNLGMVLPYHMYIFGGGHFFTVWDV